MKTKGLWRQIGLNPSKYPNQAQKSFNKLSLPFETQIVKSDVVQSDTPPISPVSHEEPQLYREKTDFMSSNARPQQNSKNIDDLFQNFMEQYKELDEQLVIAEQQTIPDNNNFSEQKPKKQILRSQSFKTNQFEVAVDSYVRKFSHGEKLSTQNYIQELEKKNNQFQFQKILKDLFNFLRMHLQQIHIVIFNQKNNLKNQLQKMVPEIMDFIEMKRLLQTKTECIQTSPKRLQKQQEFSSQLLYQSKVDYRKLIEQHKRNQQQIQAESNELRINLNKFVMQNKRLLEVENNQEIKIKRLELELQKLKQHIKSQHEQLKQIRYQFNNEKYEEPRMLRLSYNNKSILDDLQQNSEISVIQRENQMQIQKLTAELKQKTRLIDLYESNLEELRKDYEKANSEYKNQRNLIENYKSKQSEYLSNLKGYNNENIKLKTELDRLISKSTNDLNLYKKNLEQLQKQNYQIMQQNFVISQQLQALKIQKQQEILKVKNKQRRQSQQRIQALQIEGRSLKKQTTQLRKQINELEQKLKDKQLQIIQLIKDSSDCQYQRKNRNDFFVNDSQTSSVDLYNDYQFPQVYSPKSTRMPKKQTIVANTDLANYTHKRQQSVQSMKQTFNPYQYIQREIQNNKQFEEHKKYILGHYENLKKPKSTSKLQLKLQNLTQQLNKQLKQVKRFRK